MGSGAPYLDGDVGRGGDEGGAVAGEDEVVDPVGVRLDLGAELGGRGLVVGRVVVGEGVVVVVGGLGQVKAQVPGAYDAVATARVAGALGKLGRACTADGYLQRGALGVDGEAIDPEAMAARRVGQG